MKIRIAIEITLEHDTEQEREDFTKLLNFLGSRDYIVTIKDAGHIVAVKSSNNVTIASDF